MSQPHRLTFYLVLPLFLFEQERERDADREAQAETDRADVNHGGGQGFALYGVQFVHCSKFCRRWERGAVDYESAALTVELRALETSSTALAHGSIVPRPAGGAGVQVFKDSLASVSRAKCGVF